MTQRIYLKQSYTLYVFREKCWIRQIAQLIHFNFLDSQPWGGSRPHAWRFVSSPRDGAITIHLRRVQIFSQPTECLCFQL